jgi:hypothetical protein
VVSDTGDQAVDREILGPDAVECGEFAAQHMETAGEEARAFERPKVGNFLDHAELARVATRIGADRAGIRRVDIAASAARGEALADRGERSEQRIERGLTPLEQVQHRAPRRTRAKAGQTRQGLSQGFDLGRGHAMFPNRSRCGMEGWRSGIDCG